MKKIIFFAKDLNIGGIEKAIINLLNNLINYYDVTLVLEEYSGIYRNNLSKKIKVVIYKPNSNKNIIIRKVANFINRLKFIKQNYHKYDFSCAYAPYLFSACKLSKICSKNNAIYVHSDYTKIYNEKNFKIFFNKREIESFKHIIFVSNEGKKNFIKIYPKLSDKCKVISNLINEEEILTKSKEDIKIKVNSKNIIFIFVGRLDEPAKRLTRMLKCFKILLESEKNIELWIIGDGPYYNLYKNHIKKYNIEENVKMFGKQINPYKYMNKANYLILTSDYEGMPVVFNEANILDKPVISTLNVSDEYFSIENGMGFIISKNPKKMANQIKNIIGKKFNVKRIDYKKANIDRINRLRRIIDEI